METLHDQFEAARRRLGLPELPCSICETAPACVRFQIGGSEKIYLGDHRKPNGLYLDNAVDRAMTIYAHLPDAPDLLRIDECPGLQIPGLPRPEQCSGVSCYWQLSPNPPFLGRLFREIIRAELDPAGMEGLTANVYFLNSRLDLLFYLYDDRGADVAAPGDALLQPLRDTCGSWIVPSKR